MSKPSSQDHYYLTDFYNTLINFWHPMWMYTWLSLVVSELFLSYFCTICCLPNSTLFQILIPTHFHSTLLSSSCCVKKNPKKSKPSLIDGFWKCLLDFSNNSIHCFISVLYFFNVLLLHDDIIRSMLSFDNPSFISFCQTQCMPLNPSSLLFEILIVYQQIFCVCLDYRWFPF